MKLWKLTLTSAAAGVVHIRVNKAANRVNKRVMTMPYNRPASPVDERSDIGRYPFPASRLALPPAAVVSMQVTRSVAKRAT